jgi:betaine-homocysteine S-methyltransferase
LLSVQGLLERLAEGPVIGDGGFVFQLEKRGYVKVKEYLVLWIRI